MLQNDRLTQYDLRKFEAQVAAQLEVIEGRLAGVMLGGRLDQIEQQLSSLEGSSDARCEAVERRIDATQVQTEDVRAQLVSGIEHAQRGVTRIVLLGLLGTIFSTAGLCLVTIMLIT